MKKTLSFEKDLTFASSIGEVTTIDLEEDLKFIDGSNIEGSFYVSGKYKMHEASTITEDFNFNIPIAIGLDEEYVLDTTKISIENFTYEIINDNILKCKIDVGIDGRIAIILEEEEKLRECDDDIVPEEEKEIPKKEEKEIPKKEEKEKEEVLGEIIPKEDINETEIIEEEKRKNELKEEIEEKTEVVKSLFTSIGEEADTFTTYSVYIMRENDTLEGVMDKYKINKEELEKYNDLKNIMVNSKVIIPTSVDE